MYSDFENTFKTLPQFNSEPPQIVMDHLNSKLPASLKYTYLDDGYYFLANISELSFQLEQIKVPDEARELFNENSTIDDFLEYSINSQKHIEILPDNDGFFTINGSRIASNEIALAPLKKKGFENGRFIIQPPPLTETIKLELSGNGSTIAIEVHRIPNNSISQRSFSTASDAPFFFKYDIDSQGKHQLKAKYSINVSNCHSKEILEIYNVFNSFVSGKVIINGIQVHSSSCDESKSVPEHVMSFWRRVVQVEEIMHIEFESPHNMTNYEAAWINLIHLSLIEELPAKRIRSFNSLSGKGKIPSHLRKSVLQKDNMCLASLGTNKIRILGQELEFYSIRAIFDFRTVSFQEKEDQEYTVFIENAKDKNMFEAIQLFRTKEELDCFQNKEGYISSLYKAKEIDIPESI